MFAEILKMWRECAERKFPTMEKKKIFICHIMAKENFWGLLDILNIKRKTIKI